MSERLQSVFETAADLIATGDLNETLARITDRAALEVRAPNYLLAVRPTPEGELLRPSPRLRRRRGLACRRAHLPEDAERPAPTPGASCRCARTATTTAGWWPMYEDGHGVLPAGARAARAVRPLRGDGARHRDRAARGQAAATRRRARCSTSPGARRRRHERQRGRAAGRRRARRRRLRSRQRAPLGRGRGRRAAAPSTRRTARTSSRADGRVGPEDVPLLARWLEHPDPEPLFIDIDHGHRAAARVHSARSPRSSSRSPAERFLGSIVVSVAGPRAPAPTPELRDRLLGHRRARDDRAGERPARRPHHPPGPPRPPDRPGQPRRASARRSRRAPTRARARDARFTLFYVDLDGFKPINDEFGHEIGDELLCEVAERLRACLRDDDTVARLGGDEFAMLVDGIGDETESDRSLERLRGAFVAPSTCGHHRVPSARASAAPCGRPRSTTSTRCCATPTPRCTTSSASITPSRRASARPARAPAAPLPRRRRSASDTL